MSRILITRPTAQDRVGRALLDAGFNVVPANLTNTIEASGSARTDVVNAIDALSAPQDSPSSAWVTLTTPTGVRILDRIAREHGRTLADLLASAHVAAMGRCTARELDAHGITTDLLPPDTQPNANGMVWTFSQVTPGRVVLACSAIASPVLAEDLRAQGWRVDRTPTYTTRTIDYRALDDDARAHLTRLIDPWPRAAVITSSSNARALVEVLGRPPRDVAVVAVGCATRDTLKAMGVNVTASAVRATPACITRATVSAVSEITKKSTG